LSRVSFVTRVAATIAAVVVTVAVPALAQTPVSMVDCIIGGPCIGTSGNDTITGSDEQNEIYGLEGDDTIDLGNDSVRDYVYCGPGFDTVHQAPKVVPANVQDPQSAFQYASEPDVIAEDCESTAL
jgi:Ca2+-binding RTX toxin-like protein